MTTSSRARKWGSCWRPLDRAEGVHSGHDQFDGKAEGFHRRHVAFVNGGAVRQTDPHWTECPVKRIVDAVPVEVQGRPLPPRSDLFSERPGAVVGMVRVWPSRSTGLGDLRWPRLQRAQNSRPAEPARARQGPRPRDAVLPCSVDVGDLHEDDVLTCAPKKGILMGRDAQHAACNPKEPPLGRCRPAAATSSTHASRTTDDGHRSTRGDPSPKPPACKQASP